MATVSEIARKTNRMRYTPQGGQLVRTFSVTDMDPTLSDNGVRAVSIVNGFDPSTQYQAPHPTVVGFYCGGFETEMMGEDGSPNRGGSFVYVMYGTPDFIPNAVQIEISGVTGTRTINYWPSGPQLGKQILIGLKTQDGALDNSTPFADQIDPASVPASGAVDTVISSIGGSSITSIRFDTATIPIISGGAVLSFTRREPNPPNLARYRRMVNSRKFQGLDPGLWICYQITSRNLVSVSSLFPAGGYQTTYMFQTADDLGLPGAIAGFTYVEYFKDKFTGKPMVGVNCLDGSNNGYVIVTPYGEIDFNELGLPPVYS